MKHAFLQAMSILAAATASMGAQAQSGSSEAPFPSKPVRLVVPYPPGGTPDIQARMFTDKFAQRTGQPLVIDNRPGASGTMGMATVARSPADGHTIVIAPVGPWAVLPHLYNLPFDVLNDIAPVILVASTPGVLVVHPSVPVKTVRELIALARQKPGALNYGSSGIRGFGHISGEMFAVMTKTRMTVVPYKGVAAALTDLVGGHIQVLFNSAMPTIPQIKAGRVRALATTGASRMEALPDLPTIAEAGVAGYQNITWNGIGAPATTPRPVVERLNREFAAILQMPETREAMRVDGSVINGGSPDDFRKYLKSEFNKFGKLVKEAGIKPDPES